MTAGIEGNPGRAMAGSMAGLSVTVACLTDQEWEATAPMLGMSPDERVGMQCLLAELGGPAEMAKAMTAAQEGQFTNLARAGTECGLEMGPPARAAARYSSTGTQRDLGSDHAGPNTGDHPSDHRRTHSRGHPRVRPGGEWKHWIDADGDCQDARQEVLIEESLEPVTFETDRKCRVKGGQWWAPHLGHHLGNPSHIDVDHHVPLKNAHLSGGWAWSPAEKERCANYLGEENHLVAISSRHNRSKGTRGPEEWAPPDNTLWCDYASDWAEIKERWELTITHKESSAVLEMLDTCAQVVKVFRTA